MLKRTFAIVTSCVITLSLVGGLGTAEAADETVRVYNWSDYIDPDVLEQFERETGIEVVYDVFDSNDLLETKLLAGNTGYDLVFPTSYFFARQIEAGVFRELDKARIPNWDNLDPAIMERLARFDPGNQYGAVYLWGTSGIAFNDEMIRERMPDAPVESWAMVLDPEVAKRFADCGIYMLDASDEMIPAALNYIGEDPNSKDPKVIAKAGEVLEAVRPYVRKFHSSENINALANGDICLAVIWSGDAGIAAQRAEEAGKPYRIVYQIPEEGAQMWFDMMAIPADAPHPDNAYELLNFFLEPEVIARITNYVTYPNANAAADPMVDEALRSDPVVYPSPEVKERLYVVTPYDQRTQRVMTRLWQRVLTGT